MTCRQVSLSFMALVALSLPRLAGAQLPQGGGTAMPLPLSADLKKVAVGSWSEYRITSGPAPMAIRMALVSRSARGADVEVQVTGGPTAGIGPSIMRMLLPLQGDAEIKPIEQVIQLGDNPPMLVPVDLAGPRAQSFKKLDPKKRVGVDDVTGPAGTFARSDHYQDKGAMGETIDFWISKKVLPFGLVKVTSTAAGATTSAVAMELTGHGAGAKPLITKTPLPFDGAALMKQAQPALSGGAPAAGGGPPPRPIPSPHPGMPPTPAGQAPAKGAPPAAKPK